MIRGILRGRIFGILSVRRTLFSRTLMKVCNISMVFYAGERREYVKLTLLQLRAGCLQLSPTCLAGGTVFPVSKAGGRQRVVWHGSRASEAASSPPPPRHLAYPCVFGFICALRSAIAGRGLTNLCSLVRFDRSWLGPWSGCLGSLKQGPPRHKSPSFSRVQRVATMTTFIRLPLVGRWASLGVLQ